MPIDQFGNELTGFALYEYKGQILLKKMQGFGALLQQLENQGIINPNTGQIFPGSAPSPELLTEIAAQATILQASILEFWEGQMWVDPFFGR